jgi:hypothetical protein
MKKEFKKKLTNIIKLIITRLFERKNNEVIIKQSITLITYNIYK